MRHAEAWFGRCMERPWRALALAQIMMGCYIVLGAVLILRPERDAVRTLRQDIGRYESAARGQERAPAGVSAPARLEDDIGRLQRHIAAGEKLRREPAAFIAAIHPGRAEKITWQAHCVSGDRGQADERWTLKTTTDYVGLRRMLRALSDLDGMRPLTALAVSRRDRLLEIELVLSAPAGAGTEREHNKKALSGDRAGRDDAGNDEERR